MSSPLRKRIYAILRTTGISLAVIFFAFFILVQFQQYLFRHRAAKLMVDMQSIRLHQTTWAEAQTLMHRWGRWGHYEGQCTSADCEYDVTLEDTGQRGLASLVGNDFAYSAAFLIYNFFGGRVAAIDTKFIVQDGTIWRQSSSFTLAVPPHATPDDEYGYELIARTGSQQTLSWNYSSLGGHRLSPSHPNYKFGRPGGCETCMEVSATYTPYESVQTIRWLTSFNLSCITSHRYCTTVEDIFPPSEDWHLYDGTLGGRPSTQSSLAMAPSLSPEKCAVPLYALGREATSILVVDVLNTKIYHPSDRPWPRELVSALIIESLKQSNMMPSGTVLSISPSGGDYADPSLELPEHMEKGSRYIVLTNYPIEILGHLDLEFCGVLPDSPQIRKELQKGIAQNDDLRRPELRTW